MRFCKIGTAMVLMLVSLGVMEAAGRGAPAHQNTPAGDTAVAEIFETNCAVCHGKDGRGAVKLHGLPNFADPKFQSSKPDERLIASVTNGHDEMPAFGEVLKPEEIKAVVGYVRHFAPAAPSAHPASQTGSSSPAPPRGGTPSSSGMAPDSSPPKPVYVEGLLERALKGRARIWDLTHVISDRTPTYEGDRNSYRDQKQADIDKQGYTLGVITIPEHFGTHVDAPGHFIKGGATIDQLDPQHLIAPAVVIDVRDKVKANADYTVGPDVIQAWEKTNGRIPDRAVVCLLTGWGDLYSDVDKYRGVDSAGVMHFPGYSAQAVEYLLKDAKIVALGIDTLSIDNGPSKDFAAHRVALGAGLFHIENLANLDKLPPKGAVVFVGPLPLEGGSGSPARVLAIAP